MSEYYFEGIEIGAVSVKHVRRNAQETLSATMVRHEGRPMDKIMELITSNNGIKNRTIAVTGAAAKMLLDFPYFPETECLEKALSHKQMAPDMLVSLGGESFSVYPMKDGLIRNIISSSKCAAGTGEFIVQQLKRMDFPLIEGLKVAEKGDVVKLATRCSVHCKSDATHKLNKGECRPEDIVKTLFHDLAVKVRKMIAETDWPDREIVIAGGVALNDVFIGHLRELMPDTTLHVMEESHYLEAFGASLLCSEKHPDPNGAVPETWQKDAPPRFLTLQSLQSYEPLLDFRVKKRDKHAPPKEGEYILGVDAGSTTTKAVLLNVADGTIGCESYLRTHGNPIAAVKKCLRELIDQVGEQNIDIIQTAVTGSGREMVSVFFDNCLCFNEILAHARAASEDVGHVETVFEIGGQDSKFISFLNGVPIDYAMNEGCSAGTGSFLEESASVDMGVTVEDISPMALSSSAPIFFGERCAAFINTDVRDASQQGALKEDILAGLVYAISDNYISRIAGPRHLGDTILFQGGVALNRSVALSMAARTNRKIVVPPYPELMGCVGTALLAHDYLKDGDADVKPVRLEELLTGDMAVKGVFTCKTCENHCDIQNISIHEKTYPFGGLCAKYERRRHNKAEKKDALDFIEMRNRVMFEDFGVNDPPNPKGTVGMPMAITTYELYPYYATLLHEMGYAIVLSEPSREGNTKARSAICYPGEIAHGACYDLMKKQTDYIFLPYMLELNIPDRYTHSFTCNTTTLIPDVVRSAFRGIEEKLLSPYIGLSDELLLMTEKEVIKMGKRLGVDKKTAQNAHLKALSHYKTFKTATKGMIVDKWEKIIKEPTVIVAGRPYTVCSPEVNFALPRKLTSRGFHVVSADILPPFLPNKDNPKNVWHFTQQLMNAAQYAAHYPNMYICLLSCFSCGPDASSYHLVRQQLAGEVFCYLEIDSHTAHAGFETRVGAFIDIIEEKRRKDTMIESSRKAV